MFKEGDLVFTSKYGKGVVKYIDENYTFAVDVLFDSFPFIISYTKEGEKYLFDGQRLYHYTNEFKKTTKNVKQLKKKFNIKIKFKKDPVKTRIKNMFRNLFKGKKKCQIMIK